MSNPDFLGNGLGPVPGSNPGGGLVAYPNETFETPILDLTVPQLGIELVPAKPGHIAFSILAATIIESVTGTQVTPATWRAGSDAARVNQSPLVSTPSNANVNAANPPCVGGLGGNIFTSPQQQFANTPVLLDVVSGASGTGGFSLRGRFSMSITWLAVGS